MKINQTSDIAQMIKKSPSLNKRCKECIFQRRGGILRISCIKGRHNARQGTK